MITIIVTKIIKNIIMITIIVITVSYDRYESDDSGPGRSSSSSTPYLPANVSDHLIFIIVIIIITIIIISTIIIQYYTIFARL